MKQNIGFVFIRDVIKSSSEIKALLREADEIAKIISSSVIKLKKK